MPLHDRDQETSASARFSRCRTWRYALWRTWDAHAPYAMFIALNPSTADEVLNDPTVTRCMGYARDWGYGGLCMTNVFAYRQTDPELMKLTGDPVGPRNDHWIRQLARNAGIVVAAWGNHGAFRQRDAQVRRQLAGTLHCLRVTRQGQPEHPLYLPRGLNAIPWA